jgi:hypothetical protein
MPISLVVNWPCRPWLKPLDEQIVIWCGWMLWDSSGNCHLRTRISRPHKSRRSILPQQRAAARVQQPCADTNVHVTCTSVPLALHTLQRVQSVSNQRVREFLRR